MLISSYHCIFLQNCATKEHEIWLHRVSIWVNIQKNFKFLGRTVSEKKCDANFKLLCIFLENFEEMKFGCIEYPIWVNMQKNFKFLCRTVRRIV